MALGQIHDSTNPTDHPTYTVKMDLSLTIHRISIISSIRLSYHHNHHSVTCNSSTVINHHPARGDLVPSYVMSSSWDESAESFCCSSQNGQLLSMTMPSRVTILGCLLKCLTHSPQLRLINKLSANLGDSGSSQLLKVEFNGACREINKSAVELTFK